MPHSHIYATVYNSGILEYTHEVDEGRFYIMSL